MARVKSTRRPTNAKVLRNPSLKSDLGARGSARSTRVKEHPEIAAPVAVMSMQDNAQLLKVYPLDILLHQSDMPSVDPPSVPRSVCTVMPVATSTEGGRSGVNDHQSQDQGVEART